MALRVEFEDGESSEILIYSGETIETPCEPVGGYQPTTVKSLGTATPFQVTTEPVIMVENGINYSIEGRYQTITLMDIYAEKSIDELRFQDYEYRNVNRGDGKATWKPFSAGDASVACKPDSSTCQSDPSTGRPLPWAFPVHMGSNATSSSDVKTVPG